MSMKPIVLEEIALEGLDGITLDTLFMRLSNRLQNEFDELMKNEFWKLILSLKSVEFYKIQKDRPTPLILDRSQDYSDKSEDEMRENYLIYSFDPVENEAVQGSCKEFKTRQLISPSTLKSLSLQDVIDKYNQKLVIVASQNLRSSFLVPKNVGIEVDLSSAINYCVLERVARSRYYGELSSGENSLNLFIKDNRMLHYIRTQLYKFNLISKQQLITKKNSKSSLNYLMHLPRFFILYGDTPTDNTAKRFYDYLKTKPNCLAATTELLQFYQGTRKTFISFIKRNSTVFVFDTKYSYKKLYPNDTKVKKDRFISVVYLKDPNAEFPIDEDDIEQKEGLLDLSNQLLNVPLIHQVYQKIAESGNEGYTQQEIGNYFGLSRLNARSVMRRLCNSRDITFYAKDIGKQRHFKYILKKVENEAKQNVKQEIDRFFTNTSINISNEDQGSSSKKRKIEPAETKVIEISEPEVLTFDEIIGNDIKVQVTIQKVKCIPGYESSVFNVSEELGKNRLSEKIVKRMNIIIEAIQIHQMIDTNQAVNLIKEKESDLDSTICRKSMYKIASSIASANQIQIFMIEMKSNIKNVNSFSLCDNSFTLDEEFWRPFIQQKVSSVFFSIASNEIFVPLIKTIIKSENPTKFNYSNLNIAKFAKMQLFHEFLFYLIFEAQNESKEIPIQDALERWKIEYPEILDHADIDSEVEFCYREELNWKTFLKPLKKRDNCNIGWSTIYEVSQLIPLIIYAKLTKGNLDIIKASTELTELISHPIKRYYPLHYLPENLQKLFNSKKISNSYRAAFELCKRLCLCGLLKFGPNRGKEIKTNYIFLNQNASIVDTTSSEGGFLFITEKEYPKLTYKFNSSENVRDYWLTLQEISTSTRLNMTSAKEGKSEIEPTTLKLSMQCYLRQIEFEQAEKLDNGEIPGDGKGAGGLDSSFLSHLIRNWVLTGTGVQKIRKLIAKKAQDRFKVMKKTKKLKQNLKLKRDKLGVKKLMLKKGKTSHFDQVDNDIIKRNKDGRAKWSESEDKSLILAKVALRFMYKEESFPVNSTTIRDILHWKNERSIGKTSGACSRRINNLMKKPSTKQKVALYLEELGNNPDTFLKYQNIAERIKRKLPEEQATKIIKIAIVEFIILLHEMYSGDVSNSTIINEKLLELPNQYSEIIQNFFIKRPSYQSFGGFIKPNSLENIEISTLQSLIMSVIHSFKEKSISGRQALEIFQSLPENSVKTALGNLRKSQLISLTKRDRAPSATAITSFYLSSRYLQVMILNFPFSLFDEIQQGISKLTQEQQKLALNFNSCGLCILLAELSSSNLLEFSFEKAERLITIDPNVKKNTNFELISDHYIQAQATKKKGMKNVKILSGDANDESFIFNEDPIEWFLKIDTKFLHIFCILVNMKEFEDVSIRNFKLLETGWCSQNTCIFQDEVNFETILKEIAESFQIVVLQVLESEIESSNNDSVITKSNLIKFYDKFIQLNIEEKSVNDCYKKTLMKKITKVDTRRVLSKILDLGNSDASEESWIFDYKKLSKRKDESICDDEDDNTSDTFIHPVKMSNQLKDLNFSSARFHDLFVVNFSTISAKIKENLKFPIYQKNYNEIEKSILNSSVWKLDDFKSSQKNYDKTFESILKFIKTKKCIGATCNEIVEKFSSKVSNLNEIFNQLLNDKEIARVGVETIRFVHKSNARLWMISSYLEQSEEPESKRAKIEDEDDSMTKKKEVIFVRPTPWIKIDGTLSRQVLNHWLGTLLIYINSHPGILLIDLAEKFNIIQMIEIRNLCEILEQIGCVEMKCLEDIKIDIFSSYSGQNDESMTNLSSCEQIFIEVKENAMTKLSNFMKI